MAVRLWASKERESQFYQDPEAQITLDIFQSVLHGEVAPKDAARNIANIYEPIIRNKSEDQRITVLWNILCDALRSFGGNNKLNEHLVELLVSIKELPAVVDQQGNAIKHEWAGQYWTDLPLWALTFRECGIFVEADEDLQDDEWLAQATPFLNATIFAATMVSRFPDMIDMSFYAEICLKEALEGPYESPSPEVRAAMYVAPATIWILRAGEIIFKLCRDNYKRSDRTSSGNWLLWNGSGFSLGRWSFWKERLCKVTSDLALRESIREDAKRATAEMERIESSCN